MPTGPIRQLPHIGGDSSIILDIYTHRSLQHDPEGITNEEYGSAERLGELGSSALHHAVTCHIYTHHREMSASQMQMQKQSFYSEQSMLGLADDYGFRTRLRYEPSAGDLRNNAEAMKEVLEKYAGALYIRNNPRDLSAWVREMIDGDMADNQQHTQQMHVDHDNQTWSGPPPAPPPGPPPPVPSPPHNMAPGFPTLALMNQTAMQRGLFLSYSATQAGPAHLPTWTVLCVVNGKERGRGVGRSQKLAKEEAARQAWYNLGWGGTGY